MIGPHAIAGQPPANWRERVPDYEYNYEEEIADSTSDFDPFLFIRGLQLSGQCEVLAATL